MGFDKLGQKIADFFGEKTLLDTLVEEKPPTSDFLDPDYLADLLAYRLYDEEKKLYENRSSLGFVLEVIPLLGAGEEVQSEISSLMREIGEEGASIQCLIWSDYRIERFLDIWAAPRKQKQGIFSQIAERKVQFFNKMSVKGEPPPRIFRFLFSYSEPKRSSHTLTLDRLVEKKQKALKTFSRLTRNQVFEVGPQQLIEFLSGMVNFQSSPSIDARRSWNKTTWLSKQMGIPGSRIEVRQDRLIFHQHDRHSNFKTFEVTDFPDQWSVSYMGELIGDFFNKSYRIPAPFYIHYGIHFPQQQKLETKLRAKAKLLQHQIKFPSLIKLVPEIPREYEENLFVQRQLLEGEKFVETRLSAGLWGENGTCVQAESVLIALFQKYGFKLRENHFLHLPDFLSSLPMAWGEDAPYIKNLKRARCYRTTVTPETGSLVPIVGEWWRSSKGMILMGRKGQITAWDPFDVEEGNLNTVIVGPSGSGKSVFMQDLIMNHLGQGGKVYVLDLGRSFQNICHLLDGQFLEFSEKSRLNLNPFSLVNIHGGEEILNTSLEMISSIIATMAMPAHKIDKERADILSSLVKTVWERHGQHAVVDHLISLLEERHYQSELMVGAAESLKEGLKKFCKQGAYGHYFYGSQPVDFAKDFVVIETEELKNMPDLQAVILQIFTMIISNQVFLGARERRCLICIDEAWDLLKSPQMEGFIESLARRLRKYNGALVVGTQSLKDFERSHGARAAFNNSNWLLMLGKDNDSINTLKKENLIPMDDFKEAALSSLQMEAGQYSEVFIYHKGTGFFAVNQLKLDPFSAMLYSTKADEFQAVQELQNQGMSIEQAIEWLLENRQTFKRCVQNGQRVKDIIRSLVTINNSQGGFYVQKAHGNLPHLSSLDRMRKLQRNFFVCAPHAKRDSCRE